MAVPATLKDAGVDMKAFEAQRKELVELALADATTASNPVKPTAEDVDKILSQLSGFNNR